MEIQSTSPTSRPKAKAKSRLGIPSLFFYVIIGAYEKEKATMGWVSKKVYAILSSDEEGKKILEGIGEKDQDTVDKEVDGFFNKTGQSNPNKGKQSANPKNEKQPKGKEPDQPKQEQAKSSEPKYYRHPDVDGIWHDTGKTFERNGEIYKEFENEEGRTWGVSERFSKQFEEAEEPKHPFKLNKEQYPDVETTQYGFIYNVGNSSITDLAAQEKSWGRSDDDIERGFSVTKDGEEFYYDTFDEAYKAAKGSDNDGIPSQTEAEISEALMDYSWQIGESDTVGSFAESIAEKTGYSKDDVLKVIRSDNPNISESDSMAKVAGLGDVENDEDFERSWGPKGEDDAEEDEATDDDFYSPDNITKRHQKIEDAFDMPKEDGWEPSDFGEKSFIKNKGKDNEMFIQYNGADYDGNNQEWVAGYMKNGEYINKKFATMQDAKEFLDNADIGKGENHRIWNEELAQRYADGDVSHEEAIVIDYLNGDIKSEQFYKEYFKMNREKRKKADELFDKYYPGSPAEKEDNGDK